MFSIVTPSYGQLDWLRLAAASVADQEGVIVEHIIQDAGTAGIEELLSADIDGLIVDRHRLKLFVEKDAGMYDAINRGLRRASGEICGYLNCDEQYLPGTLATVEKFFALRPNVDVLFGDLVLTNKGGDPISYRRTVLPTRRHIRQSHLNTTSCATFFRRRLLGQGFYFDPKWKTIGDAVWMEKLLRHQVKMATLNEPLAVFTFTGENLGATELSQSEISEWRSKALYGTRLQRMAAVVGHRILKALAGAYRLRRVQIDVYTLDSPRKRRHVIANSVGFRWPAN